MSTTTGGMLLARRLSTQRAFVVRDEVRAAVAARRPVVALESTIITHGMPFPRNLEVARACEAAVRERGAVPATVAVLAGAVRVGLADAVAIATLRAPTPASRDVGTRRDLEEGGARTRADPPVLRRDDRRGAGVGPPAEACADAPQRAAASAACAAFVRHAGRRVAQR